MVRRLAPRVYEGGATSAHTGGGGSTLPAYLSQKSVKNKNGKRRKIMLFDALLPWFLMILCGPFPAIMRKTVEGITVRMRAVLRVFMFFCQRVLGPPRHNYVLSAARLRGNPGPFILQKGNGRQASAD